MRVVSWLVLTSACTSLELTGRVVDGPGSTTPVGGVTVTLRDAEFEVVETVVVGDDGRFAFTTTKSTTVHLVVEGDGLVSASFPGTTGIFDTFAVEDGAIHVVPEAEAQAWRDRFAGCPGADDPTNAMIIGELRFQLFNDRYPDGAAAPNSFAFRSDLADLDAGRPTTCYLSVDGGFDAASVDAFRQTRCPTTTEEDEEPPVCDPAYAMFAVEPGPGLLTAGQNTTAGSLLDRFEIWVPEGGTVSQRPTWVPLPF